MIPAALLPKIGVPLLFVAGGFLGGLTFQAKVLDKNCPELKCPKVTVPRCPDCNCPPTLGNEFEKIKNTRGTFILHLHQNYTTATDSVELRKVLNESIARALEQYSLKKKK